MMILDRRHDLRITTGRRGLALVFTFLFTCTSTATENQSEFCHNEQFTASCAADEVIIMTLAQYGRMALGRCVKKDYGYIGCGTDVIGIAHAYCSGRRSCEIPVPNAILDALEQPCPEDFKSYLRASYRCQTVLSVPVDRCVSTPVEITTPSGLIPSVVSQETPCGTYKAPWLLKAPQGQTIQISLSDYSTVSLDTMKRSSDVAMCVAYASIREKGISTPFTLCGGRESETEVYSSRSNVVEIIIQGAQQKYQRFFILKYTFHGCPDLPPPWNGWVKRTGDTSEFGCDRSEATWSLVCQDDGWVGETNNCTSGMAGDQWHGFTLPMSLSVAVVILIALCIAVCIILGGLIYVQSNRCQNNQPRNDAPQVYSEDIAIEEENSRKAFYESFPPKPEDPRLPRSLGPNGENVYASIQDNTHTLRREDLSRPYDRSAPASYYEPTRNMSAPQLGTPKQKCIGVVNTVHDHGGELREYFILDQKSQKHGQYT